MASAEMLRMLSQIWCAVVEYPEADEQAALEHIQALQLMIIDFNKPE